MLIRTTRWSHPPGNTVVPSPWQATVLEWGAQEIRRGGRMTNGGTTRLS